MEGVHLDSYQRHGNMCCRHFTFEGVQSSAGHPYRHEFANKRRITGKLMILLVRVQPVSLVGSFLARPLDQDLAGLPFRPRLAARAMRFCMLS